MTPAVPHAGSTGSSRPSPTRTRRVRARGSRVGVLALQGDFREHRVMLERLGAAHA